MVGGEPERATGLDVDTAYSSRRNVTASTVSFCSLAAARWPQAWTEATESRLGQRALRDE